MRLLALALALVSAAPLGAEQPAASAASAAPAAPAAAATRASPSPAPAVDSAAGLEVDAEALVAPRLGARLSGVDSVTVGAAVIRPGAGTAVYRLMAGGRAAGLLVDGPARLTYSVADRFSAAVARRNLRRVSRLEVRELGGGALEIAGELASAAVWGWELSPAATSEGAEAPESSKPGPAWIAERMRQRSFAAPEAGMLLADRNRAAGGEAGYRWALLPISGDVLVLEHDPRPSMRVERLGRLLRWDFPVRADDARRDFVQALVTLPVGRAWGAATEPELASVDTTVHVAQDGDEHATIVTRTKLQALRDGLRLLELGLDDGTLDEKEKYRPQRVVSLTVDGGPAAHRHSAAGLLVELPRALRRGESVVVETRTEGDVLPRPSGDRYWLLPLGDWYPRPAQSGLEHAAFHFTVDARPPFVPFAPGRVAGREATAERNRVKTELAGPMSHPSVIAGRFQSATESVEDLNVTVATYFYDKESVARRLALNVLAVAQCLQAWFQTGYPFRDLAIVEINEWGFAQAPAGMMFITQEAFLTAAQIRANSELRTMANLTVGTVDLRMAHEVAHGFFPHVAKLREPEDEWLSESFSDYVSAVCVARTMADEKRGKEQFAQALREWRTYAAKLSGESSVLLANHLAQGQEGDAAQRVWTLYAKGPLVLHALRAELARHAGSEEAGDRLFFGWFQLVVRNSEMKLLSTTRALEILDKLTGKSWQPWFEKYVYGTETPRVD